MKDFDVPGLIPVRKSAMPEKRNERLIIFTRYPEPGKTKTRLIPTLGKQGAADLQRRMTEHLISKIRRLCAFYPLSIEIRYEGGNHRLVQSWLGGQFTLKPQHEGNIGRRMRLAFEEAFQSGVDKAVIAGTDIPGISEEIIKNTLEYLDVHDLVFGPARDGGYYLVGLKKAAWSKANPSLFEGIQWGSGQVLAQSLNAADNLKMQYQLLQKLADVDRPKDLDVWYRESKTAVKSKCVDTISIIIPALDEADNIVPVLSRLQRRDGVEIIVVDGGSSDDTAKLAKSEGATVIPSLPSKARQMNAGAEAAAGNILLFLHADTQLPDNFDMPIIEALNRSGIAAGAFQLRIDSDTKGLRFIEWVANRRSRHLQAPYGDQGLFMTKKLFDKIGGYPEMPIMEDFEVVRRLRREGRIAILDQFVLTSPRRWLNLGIFKTWIINQIIIAGYLIGVSPERLSSWYRREKGKTTN
jgi:rSAM/selenodomain-associated transferase 2/rSAM/selenodomain-associated transferase 1